MNREAVIPFEEVVEELAPQRRFRPYSDYRDSEIEWLGKVPREWATKRLRFVARINPVKSELHGLGPEEDVSFVPMEAVCEHGGLILEETKPLESVYQGYTYFRNGDIVVAKITPCFENGKGSIAANLTNGVAFGTTELHVLRAQEELDPSFLFYLTISHSFRGLGTGEMYGAGGQKRVPDDFLRDFRTPIPPLPEQRSIAAFLDRETARIDELIAKKKRLIELLVEKRTSLVSYAVTKGLNPNTPMKHSGIDWVRGMPEHWETRRIKHVCKLETGHTPRKSEETFWVVDECTIPWISLNDTKTLESCDFIGDTAVKISPTGMQNSAAHLIVEGAVVFNRDGARVGLSAITTKPMCVSQHLIAWACGPLVSNQYLLHALYAMEQEIYRITAGATIPTIGMSDVGRMTIPLPPRAEQESIVTFLHDKRGNITKLLRRIEDGIQQLCEYRTAVISAAVTGKIDVRGFQPGEAQCQ